MKRSVLSVLVALLVIGGTGYAWGSVGAPSGRPAHGLPDEGPVTRELGRHNPTLQREFVPLATPCRLYDSRTSGGLVPADGTRIVTPVRCPEISLLSSALEVSISSIDPRGPGFLRAWANETPEPTQTVLQWGASGATAGTTVNVGTYGIRFRVHGSATHVAVDVSGYWVEPTYASVLTASTTQYAEVRSSSGMFWLVRSDLARPGELVLGTRRDITFCDLQATPESPLFLAAVVRTSPDTLLVRVADAADRPARAYVSVSVTC